MERVYGDRQKALMDVVAVLDRIAHPSIVRIHDLLPDPDEEYVFWLVQDLLDGSDLTSLLRPGPLATGVAQALCQTMLSALAALHEQSLVHGALSPACFQQTSNGFVLTGIAQARLVEPAAQYLAPERWSRKAPQPPSDVYAFGACVYEALTGTAPFPTDLPRAEYARLHREQGIPDVVQRRRSLPPDLLSLVRQCTRPDPKTRPSIHTLLGRQQPATSADPPSPQPAQPQSTAQVSPPAATAVSSVSTPPQKKATAPPVSTEDELDLELEVTEDIEKPVSSGGGLLLLGLGGGLVALAGVGLLASTMLGPSGLSGWLHQGPEIHITNPTAESVTAACSAGPDEQRVGAVVDPGETKILLLAGAPADCIAFTSNRTVTMQWHGEVILENGQPWTATVGEGVEEADTGMPEAAEAVALNLLEQEALDTAPPATPPQPAPVVRTAPRRQAAAPEPEPEPVGLQIAVNDRRRRLAKDVDVYVDGESVGQAPVTHAVLPGSHVVRWVKDNRLDISCTVQVPPSGAAVEIDPSEPICPGAAPAGASADEAAAAP